MANDVIIDATAKVRYAHEAAREALREYLPVLRLPGEHEGADVVRVKENAARTVWRCILGNEAYYLKHYHPPGLWRRMRAVVLGSDAAKEMRYSRRLTDAGVPTAEVLAVGAADGATWMLSRAVEPATPADQWHDARAESTELNVIREVRTAIAAAAELIGRMHAAGVCHNDLHAGNILLRGAGTNVEAVLMDLHRASRRTPSRRVCAKNLAQLMYARMHVTTRTQRLAFLKRYVAAAGLGGSLRGWRIMVEHFAAAHAKAQYAARDRRARGNNKYFSRLRLPGRWRGRMVLASKRKFSAAAELTFTANDWRAAMADIDALFACDDATTVKDSPSALVIRRPLRIGTHTVDVYVKRNRRKYAWKALVDAFRPSRAIRAFDLGHALLTRQIHTALPLAALERRVGPLLTDSILITESVTPAEPLNRFFDRWLSNRALAKRDIDAASQQRLARGLLHQLGRLLHHLHANGMVHRDMKASNVLVHWDRTGAPQVVLIDLDGLSRPWRVTTRRMFQGLMRLNVSLLECPSVNHAGRLRMLLGYLRHPGSGRIAFKPYWRELERWSAKKLNRQITHRRQSQKRLREQ